MESLVNEEVKLRLPIDLSRSYALWRDMTIPCLATGCTVLHASNVGLGVHFWVLQEANAC
jgi:hypothetical protein